MSSDPFGLLGQVLDGQYRVEQLVGEGGFSAVYRGTHLGLEEPIAIKCLKLTGALAAVSGGSLQPMGGVQEPSHAGTRPSRASSMDAFVQRFRDEGRILYRLSQGNLNVVRCIASGTTTAPATGALLPYLVLEWLEGRSLAQDFEERRARGLGGRSLAEVITLLDGAADAVAYAHAQGVVHRDLNPGNIFLAVQRDGTTRTKVLDFGVAKVIGDDLALGPRTQTLGQIRIFSPAYAAPEQFDASLAPAGPHTDVYTFALVATELLIGRHVLEGDSLGAFLHHTLDRTFLRTPKALGANVTAAVEMVFARALSIEARRRPKDVGQLWRELRAAASAEDLSATVRTASPETDLPSTDRDELPPTTTRLPANPQQQQLAALKQTTRMAGPPSHTVATSALFQAPPVPPPPGTHIPEPSVSLPAVQVPPPFPMVPPGAPFVPTVAPAVASSRAAWMVGLLVFVVVLVVGGALLRFWLLD